MDKKQNRRKILKKLSNRYRLLIINETNLQEKTSLSLTASNILLIGSAGLLLFSLISWGIFTLFPGVKDYAPGYGQTFDGKMKNSVLRKMSKLENELAMAQKRELAMKQIISGEEVTAYDIPYKADKSRKVELTINETKAEGERVKDAGAQIERAREKESSSPGRVVSQAYQGEDGQSNEFLFFTPVSGEVSDAFRPGHPSLDISPQIDESVKATLDGTVVFSGWTPEFGFVISLQHSNNWTSVYKFNAAVYKEPGAFVRAGETIGITGYTDKNSPGKKLRFELWHDGIAVDPLNYIVF